MKYFRSSFERRFKEESMATQKHFHRILKRVQESFTRGKDMFNDDLQNMKIRVQEVKQARRNLNLLKKITKMNDKDTESETSDFDKQYFNPSGTINIKRIKESSKVSSSFKGVENYKRLKQSSTNKNFENAMRIKERSNYDSQNEMDLANKTWELKNFSNLASKMYKDQDKAVLTRMSASQVLGSHSSPSLKDESGYHNRRRVKPKNTQNHQGT